MTWDSYKCLKCLPLMETSFISFDFRYFRVSQKWKYYYQKFLIGFYNKYIFPNFLALSLFIIKDMDGLSETLYIIYLIITYCGNLSVMYIFIYSEMYNRVKTSQTIRCGQLRKLVFKIYKNIFYFDTRFVTQILFHILADVTRVWTWHVK